MVKYIGLVFVGCLLIAQSVEAETKSMRQLGVGLAPDVWVSTPDALLESGTDRIFETAVEILQQK